MTRPPRWRPIAGRARTTDPNRRRHRLPCSGVTAAPVLHFRPAAARPGSTQHRDPGRDRQGLVRWDNDARTGMPPGVPEGAMCVQRFDDSLNSAIHITYRISLRSSSMPEPRDPLLKVFASISRWDSDCYGTQDDVGLPAANPSPPTADGPGGGVDRRGNRARVHIGVEVRARSPTRG